MSWLPPLWHLCTWNIYWTHRISDTAHSGKTAVISMVASLWLYDTHALKYLRDSAMLRGQSALPEAPSFCVLSMDAIQVSTCIHFPENNVISFPAARKTVRTPIQASWTQAYLSPVDFAIISLCRRHLSTHQRPMWGTVWIRFWCFGLQRQNFGQIIKQQVHNEWPESLGFRDRLLPGERPYLRAISNLTTSSLLLNYWAHRNHPCSGLWGWCKMIIKCRKWDESLLAFHMVILGEHLSVCVCVHVCVVCTPAYMCMPSHGRRETCLPWHTLRSKDNLGELSLSTRWILGTEFRLSCLTPSSSPHWAILPVILLAFINMTFFFPVGWVSLHYISLRDYTNHGLSCTLYVVPQKSLSSSFLLIHFLEGAIWN